MEPKLLLLPSLMKLLAVGMAWRCPRSELLMTGMPSAEESDEEGGEKTGVGVIPVL